MLVFDSAKRSVASNLIKAHKASGVESYWAVDAQGEIYQNSGNATVVRALPDLERRYDDPAAAVVYHHSHPDERALSPSDLQLIGKPGVQEIWAHTPDHIAYGAGLKPGVCKQTYLSEFQNLGGWMTCELFGYEYPTALSPGEYRDLCDLAVMTALAATGWIEICIDSQNAPQLALSANARGYNDLVAFFQSKMKIHPP